jgi:hypothetical protein
VDDVRRTLREGHPLSFLTLASTLLTVVDPRVRDPFERPGEAPPRLERDEFISTLLEIDERETTALLTAFAELSGDELTTSRLRRELAPRNHVLPAWLLGLRHAKVYRAVEMVHILGDGDDIMLGVRFPTGQEMAVVVYVDHNLGTVVKDAFVIPGTLAELVTFMRGKSGDDPDTAFNDIDAADARARVAEAIEAGAGQACAAIAVVEEEEIGRQPITALLCGLGQGLDLARNGLFFFLALGRDARVGGGQLPVPT